MVSAVVFDVGETLLDVDFSTDVSGIPVQVSFSQPVQLLRSSGKRASLRGHNRRR